MHTHNSMRKKSNQLSAQKEASFGVPHIYIEQIIPQNLQTVCTRSSDPILCKKLLYKIGYYFLDIYYV